MRIPHELDLFGIYLPPILLAASAGIVLAAIAAKILNKYKLAKYFVNTPLVFIAMAVIFTILLGFTVFPF